MPEGVPAILGDSDRLTQALVNLLSNAIKFAPRGSAVTVSARATADRVAISVADHGRGIAPADIARLFQKFQQLDDPGTRQTGGTGLGLSITRAIVEEHGGTITVDSMVGQVTTFTFTVPQATAVPSRAADAGPRPRTVLIAEENAADRRHLAAEMANAGFTVIEAATGDEAVRDARAHQPDAITVTFTMRDSAGRSVAETLSHDAETQRIPLVITVSGEAGTGAGRLEKPVDLSDLVARVQRVLEGRVHATVLVADDDEDVRLVLRKTLERHGFRVLEAADGKEALALAARHTVDLALLDLNMPQVHGYDVIRALRKREATAHLPIIVLSGSVGARHSLESLVIGANVFLTKPTDHEALVREVDRLLRREPVV